MATRSLDRAPLGVSVTRKPNRSSHDWDLPIPRLTLHVPNTCMAPVQKKTADFTGHIPENESLFAMPTAYRTKLTVPEVYRSRGS